MVDSYSTVASTSFWRNRAGWFAILIFCLGFGRAVLQPQSCYGDDPPNILVILTDDQGWATIGCYGGQIVPTPHLDRLASQGLRLTDAYVTSQCTPTRASFLTGQYTARHGLWHVLPWYGYPWARMTEPPFAENFGRDRFTFAKGLQLAGYATGIMGKWHLTSNADGKGRGLNPNAAHHYGFDFAPPILALDEFAAGADRGVDTLTDQAIDFIRERRDRPWFCFLSHHMIHGEVVAPLPLVEKYRKLGYDDDGPNRAVYLAGLEHIDHSIGRLMEALDEMHEADETLVIFTSDNGGIDQRWDFQAIDKPHPRRPVFSADKNEYDNAPLRMGKGSVYEGGVRVPFIARWPGHVQPGSVSDVPIHIVDLAATFLELAGTEAPAEHPLDGESLVNLLRGEDDSHLRERPIFQYYPFYDLRWGLTPSASIRQGNFKLIEFFGDRVDDDGQYIPAGGLELYNLSRDIGETNNLAVAQPARAAAMQDQLREWMTQVGATMPVSNPRFDPTMAFRETKRKP